METLTIEYIAPYLPYKLKVENLNYKCDYVGVQFSILTQLYDFNDGHWHYKTTADNIGGLEDCKPVLRPLSDLTKEQLFLRMTMPIVNLLEIEFPNFKDLLEVKNPVITNNSYKATCIIESDPKSKFTLSIAPKNDINIYKNNNISMMFSRMEVEMKLFEWHFDVFCLIEKGLAIDINTINHK